MEILAKSDKATKGSSRFDDVQLVYTAEHEQYFFLNMPLLRERADLLSSSSNDGRPTTFILLDQTETIVRSHFLGLLIILKLQKIEPPPEVIETIKLIAASSESPIKLPEDITAQTLVPLSGFLLEFPVSYVPRSDSGTFLCGVALDVYEATIVPEENCGKTNNTRDHTLLKFSSPSHLGRTYDTLAPDSIVEDLDALFRNRLESVSCSWTLRFNHTVITQDRVAL